MVCYIFLYMFNRSYMEEHQGHPHHLTDSKILSLQKRIQFSSQEEELIRLTRNLSDPTKLKIYLLLESIAEISVTDLTQILELSQSAVSHALTDLRNIGLVWSHRCGQLICYSLVSSSKKRWLAFWERLK